MEMTKETPQDFLIKHASIKTFNEAFLSQHGDFMIICGYKEPMIFLLNNTYFF